MAAQTADWGATADCVGRCGSRHDVYVYVCVSLSLNCARA